MGKNLIFIGFVLMSAALFIGAIIIGGQLFGIFLPLNPYLLLMVSVLFVVGVVLILAGSVEKKEIHSCNE